jgi:hypothetical protein
VSVEVHAAAAPIAAPASPQTQCLAWQRVGSPLSLQA